MKAQRMSGWRVFAAAMMIFVGAVNIVQGVVAWFTPGFYAIAEEQMLLFGYAFWGMLLAVWGAVLVLAGLAVLSGSMWARAVGVVAAGLNAIAQLAFIEPHPVWSVLAIAVDIAVVYGLTAGWSTGAARTGRATDTGTDAGTDTTTDAWGRTGARPGRPVDPAAEAEAYRAGRADADNAPVPGDETREPGSPLHHGKHAQRLS